MLCIPSHASTMSSKYLSIMLTNDPWVKWSGSHLLRVLGLYSNSTHPGIHVACYILYNNSCAYSESGMLVIPFQASDINYCLSAETGNTISPEPILL